MSKNLLIVFVKNIKLGKVKTRLAKTIGNQGAFEVYKELVQITENATDELTVDKHIYFSDVVIETKWQNDYKTVQQGETLGDRMKNAFHDGFKAGYENVILIGSDLPSLTSSIINKGFNALENNEAVFGPAEDGGYYLVGFSKMKDYVFENKPWSQPNLLEVTKKELQENNASFGLLKTLNDIDNIEDLQNSILKNKFSSLIENALKQL